MSCFFCLMIRRPPRSTPLSLHDALPIYVPDDVLAEPAPGGGTGGVGVRPAVLVPAELFDLLVLGQRHRLLGAGHAGVLSRSFVGVLLVDGARRPPARSRCAVRSSGTGRAGPDLFPARV